MWWSIPFLIIFPMCIGALLYCIHVQKIRKGIAYIATPAIMAATIDLVVTYFRNGGSTCTSTSLSRLISLLPVRLY